MTKRSLKRFLSWLQSPGDTLQQRVIHGGVWVASLNIIDRFLQIIRLIILARLLSPADFGLLGIAMLTIAVLNQLTHLGIDSALIQREETNIDTYLDTAWILKLVRGGSIFIFIFVSAPLVAVFFGEPRAEPILRTLGLLTILDGFVNPSVVYFRKKLEFHKQFIYQMSGTVVDIVVAVGAALLLQNVWALVYGVLAGRTTRLAISYVLSGYRPSICFDWAPAERMLSFGKWIWATGVVVFVATSGDDIFVGWYLTATALGFYQMAFRLSNAPASEVTHVITSVTFPVYSKLQNDRNALRNAFLKTIRVTFLIAIPIATGILLIAPSFTRVVLGEQWLPMVLAMQIMTVAGLIRAIAATGGAVFQGLGVPHWDFRMNLIRASAIVLTIWPLTDQWGITGAAISITFGIFLTLPIWLYKTADITDASFTHYPKSLLAPVIGSIIMSVPVLTISGPELWRIITAILVGALVYFVSVYPIYEFQGENPITDVLTLAR